MPLDVPQGYEILNDRTVPHYLAGLPGISERLGGRPEDWSVKEVGDGNLNLVFLVEGPAGGLCLKQGLPYVRLVGEGWPLSPKRTYFEQLCLAEHGRHVGRLVPELYHYDPRLFAIVMERLSPHIIMRRGMVQAIRYPNYARDMAEFMARSLFFTSDLAMPAAEKKAMLADFAGNSELCGLTEEVIFTDPYRVHERNRWTSPQLDDMAASFRNDAVLKVAISQLKRKFLSSPEALIHGDLHTGSIMVMEDDTRVIDSEFAFFGPMGFDIGAQIGNLLINYFSQDGHGHGERQNGRADYQEWVLATLEQEWTLFRARFLELWGENATGPAYDPTLFADPVSAAALEREREGYMDRLFAESLGFAAAKMIRRILGIAHNIDLELIDNPDVRAACERRCLILARDLMLNAGTYTSITDVAAAARAVRATTAEG